MHVEFWGQKFEINVWVGCVLGLLMAVVSSMFGFGGGPFMIAIMTLALGMPMYLAVGSSLLVIFFNTVTGTMAVNASLFRRFTRAIPRSPALSACTNRRQGCPRSAMDSTSSELWSVTSGNALASAHWRTKAGTGQPSGEKKRIVGRVRTRGPR